MNTTDATRTEDASQACFPVSAPLRNPAHGVDAVRTNRPEDGKSLRQERSVAKPGDVCRCVTPLAAAVSAAPECGRRRQVEC
jgi:hypothetical protein